MDLLSQLVTTMAPYGPVGLLCVYFVWREQQRDKRDKEREKLDLDREVRREAMEEKRIEADKNLAVSMALLAERVK